MPSIELKPFTSEDFPRLAAWVADEALFDVWGGRRFAFPLPREAFLEHVERSDTRVFVAVIDGRPAGHGEVARIRPDVGSAFLSRILVAEPELRGRGLGAALTARLVEVVLDQLGLGEVSLHVRTVNTAAIACYRRVGFEDDARGLARDPVPGEPPAVRMTLRASRWRAMQRNS